jgi:hypothetical protein
VPDVGVVDAQERPRPRATYPAAGQQVSSLSEVIVSKYSFTVQVSGIQPVGNYEDRLFEAGCADALISVVDDVMFLDFDRDAPSLTSALASARDDVTRAGGHVERVLDVEG